MTTSCCSDAKNAILGIFALGTHRTGSSRKAAMCPLALKCCDIRLLIFAA